MKYFDYTATTPIDNDVLDTYVRISKDFIGNTASLHKKGQEALYMFEKSRDIILDTLKFKNHHLIFTSNATESNNLAILGVALKSIQTDLQRPKIITTSIEHSSVFSQMNELEKKADVIYLDPNNKGIIDCDKLEKQMDKNVILVSIMWVNNIVGVIQNIKEVIKIVKKYPKALLHVDGVQGITRVEPDFDINDIDIFTFSAHKIYGPKGIGGLVIRKNIDLYKVLKGSNVQYGIKPGTIPLPLVTAFSKAVIKYFPKTKYHSQYVQKLWEYLYEALSKRKLVINTPNNNISYYIMNISITNVKSETALHLLEKNNIYVSIGSACSSKSRKPERTVYKMTKDEKIASSSIRISLSHLTKKEEIDDLIKAIDEVLKESYHEV